MVPARRWTTEEIITACRFCWMCRHVCTVGNVTCKESHTPRGKTLLLYSMLAEMNIPEQEIADCVYKCALCYRCMENCVSAIDVPQVMLNTRAEMVREGSPPSEIQNAYDSLMKERGSALSLPYKTREHGLDRVGELPDKAPIILFGGRATYTYTPGALSGASEILKAARIDHTILGQQGWSGYEFYEIGYLDDAIHTAKETLELLENVIDDSSGPAYVITLDPSDNWALGELYRQWGLDVPFNVIDFSSYVKQLVDSGEVSFRDADIEVCYHDPCHLGRLQRVFTQPRELLSSISGLVIKEMHWNREQAYCCGGHIRASDKSIATGAVLDLVKEIKATQAPVVVTACPTCCDSLKQADNVFDVYHIAEFLAQYLRSNSTG